MQNNKGYESIQEPGGGDRKEIGKHKNPSGSPEGFLQKGEYENLY